MESDKYAIKLSYIVFVFVGISVIIGVGIWILGPQLQIPLIFSIVFLACMKFYFGYSWEEIEENMVKGFLKISRVVMLFIGIGMLMGIWVACGSVPTLVYYGLKTLTPAIYLVMVLFIMSFITYAMGTSIGAAGTVGVALLIVGQAMGIPVSIAAGAIVSGAFWGDRTSPLSTAFNVTVATTEVAHHILVKDLLLSIIPVWLVTAGVYGYIGWDYGFKKENMVFLPQILSLLAEKIHISPVLLLPPLILIILANRRVPLLVNITGNIAISSLLGIMYQDLTVKELLTVMYKGSQIQTENTFIYTLLNRGGIVSVLELIVLCLIVGIFVGLLEGGDFLQPLIKGFNGSFKKSSLINYSMITTIFGNAISGAQVFAILLTGTIFNKAFDKTGMDRLILARVIADSGTISSPLIPWNINAMFMTAILGVTTFHYAPYAILCWLTPLVTFFVLNVKMRKSISQGTIRNQ